MGVGQITVNFDDDVIGLVTNMFDDWGHDVEHPLDAAVVVGQYTNGPNEGKWFTCDVRGLDWEPYRVS